MGWDLGSGASKIFWQLPFFRNLSAFSKYSAGLGLFLFERHIVQIYLQADLEAPQTAASE